MPQQNLLVKLNAGAAGFTCELFPFASSRLSDPPVSRNATPGYNWPDGSLFHNRDVHSERIKGVCTSDYSEKYFKLNEVSIGVAENRDRLAARLFQN
jgi:hypothetical protein